MLGANTSMYAGVPTPYLLAHATNVLNHPPTRPQVFRTNTPTTWPEHVNDTPDTSDTTTPLLLQHITPFNVLQVAKVAKFPRVLNTAPAKTNSAEPCYAGHSLPDGRIVQWVLNPGNSRRTLRGMRSRCMMHSLPQPARLIRAQ